MKHQAGAVKQASREHQVEMTMAIRYDKPLYTLSFYQRANDLGVEILRERGER